MADGLSAGHEDQNDIARTIEEPNEKTAEGKKKPNSVNPPFQMGIQPDSKLIFAHKSLGLEGCKLATETVMLTNCTCYRQAFKVKCTTNNIFRIRPSMGFCEVGQSTSVSVSFFGIQIPEDDVHYLSFYHLKCRKKDEKPDDVWTNDAVPDGVHRLHIFFEKSSSSPRSEEPPPLRKHHKAVKRQIDKDAKRELRKAPRHEHDADGSAFPDGRKGESSEGKVEAVSPRCDARKAMLQQLVDNANTMMIDHELEALAAKRELISAEEALHTSRARPPASSPKSDAEPEHLSSPTAELRVVPEIREPSKLCHQAEPERVAPSISKSKAAPLPMKPFSKPFKFPAAPASKTRSSLTPLPKPFTFPPLPSSKSLQCPPSSASKQFQFLPLPTTSKAMSLDTSLTESKLSSAPMSPRKHFSPTNRPTTPFKFPPLATVRKSSSSPSPAAPLKPPCPTAVYTTPVAPSAVFKAPTLPGSCRPPSSVASPKPFKFPPPNQPSKPIIFSPQWTTSKPTVTQSPSPKPFRFPPLPKHQSPNSFTFPAASRPQEKFRFPPLQKPSTTVASTLPSATPTVLRPSSFPAISKD